MSNWYSDSIELSESEYVVSECMSYQIGNIPIVS